MLFFCDWIVLLFPIKFIVKASYSKQATIFNGLALNNLVLMIFETYMDFSSGKEKNEIRILILLNNKVVWNKKQSVEFLNYSPNSNI